MNRLLLGLLGVFFVLQVQAQKQNIAGIVTDEKREPLIGATVRIPSTEQGTLTDIDGKFSLEYTGKFPVKLVFSYVGYQDQELTLQQAQSDLKIRLKEDAELLDEAVVSDVRITQKQKQAALTVESLDNIAIKATPAPNFYEGLSHLKGVDISAASIGFKVINTRGFNSTSPVRSLQLIDGVDNQAPGLNFSLGNFLGAPELDVNRVELIAGASSAFFGPNAFNGAILMNTKDPFTTPGFSASIKLGERALSESAIRWAKVGLDKKGKPLWAYKVNLFWMSANDWQAYNTDPTPQSPSLAGNPGGWDAVNIYGDEYQLRNDRRVDALKNPGLGIYYRTGYKEPEMVDYGTRNLKSNLAFHYRLPDSSRLIYNFNFGFGTTVYQGDNRLSLKDILLFQNRVEWQKENKFFIRFYATHENAGNSYDAYRTALIMQGNAKNDAEWSRDYANYWSQNIDPRIRNLPGFPGLQPGVVQKRDSFLNNHYADSLIVWHQRARDFADNQITDAGQSKRYAPGTPEFDSAYNAVRSTKTTEGGSLFYDKSALYHLHGQYQWDTSETGSSRLEITVGANGRLYAPNSDGTIFLDTNGRKVRNAEFGAYGGVARHFFDNKVKIAATVRMDKNINFPVVVSPALSAVLNQKEHTFRASFSSAIRNPTLTDQYFNMNVGRATLLGNLSGYQNLVSTESYINFLNSTPRNTDLLQYFNVDAVKPERVTTAEVGYRSILDKKWFIDVNYYYSWYTDFLGYIIGVELELDSTNAPANQRIVRVTTNSKELVTTQGVSIGVNYYMHRYLSFTGNYTWNVLDLKGNEDPIIPAFNTPAHKFNLGINGKDLKWDWKFIHLRQIGYNVNFRWLEGFMFEGSPQFTGEIPTYYQLDAQINYEKVSWNTIFKLGASNLTNNKVYQVYGGPLVGRLIYFSVTYELDKWK